MAKSLGQIHNVLETASPLALTNIGQAIRRIDLPGLLSDQLQHMVRAGNNFKLCGIDLGIKPNVTNPGDGASITGYIRYYSPTKGRCAAFRHAFKSCADLMQAQGVPMRMNKLYDFRPALTNNAGLQNVLKNQATLDGVIGLALNSGTAGASVFGVYNKSVVPTSNTIPVGDLFDEGFDTILAAGAAKTDFVLNEASLYDGNPNFADLTYSEIPFAVSFAQGNMTPTFQFRPDPALYVAVLAGQMELVIDDMELFGGATSCELSINCMVSGWKSIMGNPDKKRASKKKSSSKKRSTRK